MKYHQSDFAFTIVELLVVISVITILLGIGQPKIKGFMDLAKKTQAKNELKTMQAAIQSYYIFSRNAYPPSSTTVGASYLNTATPKIIKGALTDPFTSSTEYNYLRSGNGKYFVVYSVGLNGVNGNFVIFNNGVVTGRDGDDMCATNGNGCEEGTTGITCATGYSNCFGTCVDLSSNTSHCGACASACSTNWGCCTGVCKNLQTDTSNCGACSVSCATCVNGVGGGGCSMPSGGFPISS